MKIIDWCRSANDFLIVDSIDEHIANVKKEWLESDQMKKSDWFLKRTRDYVVWGFVDSEIWGMVKEVSIDCNEEEECEKIEALYYKDIA